MQEAIINPALFLTLGIQALLVGAPTWAIIRYILRVERRIMRIELKLGLALDSDDD